METSETEFVPEILYNTDGFGVEDLEQLSVKNQTFFLKDYLSFFYTKTLTDNIWSDEYKQKIQIAMEEHLDEVSERFLNITPEEKQTIMNHVFAAIEIFAQKGLRDYPTLGGGAT